LGEVHLLKKKKKRKKKRKGITWGEVAHTPKKSISCRVKWV